MIKNLNLQVLLALIISLCILACTKENSFLTEDIEQEKVVSTLEITGLQLENGLLQFETSEVFAKIVQEHANTEDELLDEWEKSIGFQSMRSVHLAAELEQEQVSFQEEADAFLQKWDGLVRFMEDGTVEPIVSTSLTKFLNAKGMFKIDEMLYQITEEKTIAILDGDWDKFKLASNLPENYTDESEGIYIISRTSPIMRWFSEMIIKVVKDLILLPTTGK